jgi:photosystem II stability/assembly factor-like uncharacterized protein
MVKKISSIIIVLAILSFTNIKPVNSYTIGDDLWHIQEDINPDPDLNTLFDIHFVNSSFGWAAGDGGTVLHWDGVEWSRVPSYTGVTLRSISMLDETTGWIIGKEGVALRWDGENFTPYRTSNSDTLTDVVTLSGGIAWAVGSINVSYKFNGTNWVYVPGLSRTMFGIDCLSENQCWAVGDGGETFYWGGISWSPTGAPSSTKLYDVKMLSPTNGWAAGDQGIFHWDGFGWEEYVVLESPMKLYFENPDYGWAVGWAGNITKWNGITWSSYSSPISEEALRGVSFSSPNDGWSVGDNGLFLYYFGIREINEKPIADAGEDQSTNTLSIMTLQGDGTDPDGNLPLSYHWSQTGGTPVTLSSATVSNPSFTAPINPGSLTFSLVVSDSLELDSDPDEVTITVNNQAPIADAGVDQIVTTLSIVTIEGNGSDPDSDLPLSFQWTQTSGPSVVLSSYTIAKPSFTTPDDPASLTFSLVVTDSLGLPSSPDEMIVTINNQSPTSNAGIDQNVDILSTVNLNGNGTDPDNDLPLTYQWAQTSGPAVTLSSSIVVNPSFTAPNYPAELTFSFVVTDSLGLSSSPDLVKIIVSEPPPDEYLIFLPLIIK